MKKKDYKKRCLTCKKDFTPKVKKKHLLLPSVF